MEAAIYLVAGFSVIYITLRIIGRVISRRKLSERVKAMRELYKSKRRD